MKITFQNKEESNQQQEAEFLALSKTERFLRFLSLSTYFLKFPSKTHKEKKDNFIINLNTK
ncbi:MAG: hypothetical protein ACLGGV_05620 [Bacteroidia bacterium]